MKNKSGFSLIEVIIACAIVGIMTVVFIVFFNKNTRYKKEVEVAAREVASAVREVQNYSLNGKVNDSSTEFACATRFRVVPGSDYEMRYSYHGSGNSCNYSAYNGAYYPSKSLSNGVQFTSPSTNINYLVPHGKLIQDGGAGTPTVLSDSTIITITVSKNGFSQNICVYGSGKIVEQEAACT